MNPTILEIGQFQLKWYSVLILIAFIVGFFIVLIKSRNKDIPKSYIYDIAFYLIIFCILGARIYYCLFNFDYYRNDPMEILRVWNGGLAIHGGIIAGIIFLLIYTKKKKIIFLDLTDIIAPALALGQAIGRWGNFFNQEAYGSATTFFELKRLHIPQFIMDGMYIHGTYHHPTFLYESIGCLVIFIILMIISNIKKIKKGFITGLYFITYGIIRFFIESLRTDSLMLGNIKVAQLVSIIMVVIGSILIFLSFRRKYDK